MELYRLAWRLFGVNIALVSPDMKSNVCLGTQRTISGFCRRLQEHPRGKELCKECDLAHFRQALNSHKPLRYHCHAGLTEFIIPISAEGETVALLQCGQLLDSPPDKAKWKTLKDALENAGMEAARLERPFFKIRNMPPPLQDDLILLLELIGNYIAQTQRQLQLAEESRQSQIVSRARAYIKDHFAEGIALNQVAKASYTSIRNLCRIFKQETGVSVVDFIHEVRIRHASTRLLSSGMQCAEIASECGFGSVQQFNRVFRKLRASSPAQWRRQRRMNAHRPQG